MTRSGAHEQPHPQTEVCSQRQLSTCARGGTVQKPLRRCTREGFATDVTKPTSPVLARVLVPLRLEEGETSQELGGLLRPSPSHCGDEDHQPRATPCSAELRVGPLLSSPGFFQDLLTTERSSPPGCSVGAVVTPWWCPRRAVILRTVATHRPQSPNGDLRLLALPHPSP